MGVCTASFLFFWSTHVFGVERQALSLGQQQQARPAWAVLACDIVE